MNKTETKEMLKATYDKQASIIDSLPDGIDIDGIQPDLSDGFRVAIANATFEENTETLHQLRQHCGNYKLGGYYACGRLLALEYEFSNFDVMMYCTDRGNALNIIGNGKCRIEIIQKSQSSMEVVCAVPESES